MICHGDLPPPISPSLVPNTDFGTLTPLEQGPGECSRLWAKILVTAVANGFPISSVMIGSDPTCTYNPTLVCITGFPKKTIIIDQRLPCQGKDGVFSNINERAAMVLREIGRWKFSNPMIDSAIIIVLTLIYVGIFDYVAYSSDLYSSIFGFGERSVAVGILLFLYVIPPANVVVRFVWNAKTRSQEFKADAFTKDLGYGAALRSCLLKFMVGAAQAVSRHAYAATSAQGEMNGKCFEALLKNTGKESLQWGLAAGMYSGITYGLKEATGTHDWKSSAVAGAVTGMAMSLTTDNPSNEKLVQSAITGAAISTVANLIGRVF